MLSPNTDGAEAASPSITTEEADQLDHSTKRAKKVVDRGGTRSNARAGEPSQGRSGVADDPKVGYVAALQGSQIGAGSGIFLGEGKGEGVRAAAGRPKVLTRKSVDQGLTRASPVQKPDASGFTRLTILRRNGYGRTNPLAAAQHQDSPRVQGAGPADAAHLQVDGAAANSTCGESFCLIRDPDSNRDDSTLACEGLNDMEDDLPKVNFQLLDGVILDGRVGEEDERVMAIDELA
ncbi:hypothetical protein CDL15_Pgr006430 [Punica granatum]|uniref:Uncharacterized protein n=1 Tax=Punica granatum TaxID=22663 RepID=A0A218XZT2_PUNGR|nr:hypothetical protein CDL15_Pgr006430 [Punica granatum]